MTSSKQKMPIMENNDVSMEVWLDIFKNKTRFRILQLLFVYGEVSLTELSNHMDMKKPALYHHLRKMIKSGVVKVSREEQVRGSIKAKFYTLDNQTALRFLLISEEDLLKIKDRSKLFEVLKSIINTYRSSISLFRSKMDMLETYTSLLEEEVGSYEDPSVNGLDILKLILDYDIGFHAQYLTEIQYKKFLEYSHEFYGKINDMILEDDSESLQDGVKPIERPYFTLSMVMPLKKML